MDRGYHWGMQAAFFDLDKTIISRSSSLALSRPMYRAGMVTRGQLARGAYAQLVYALVGADEKKMDRLKEGMLQLTKGWDRAGVERLVHDVIIDVIDPFVYQEALDLIELHRQEGRRVFIVSSSPEEVVRPLARHFGVSDVIATRAMIVDGRYTGELEFYCYGDGKAQAIRDLADRSGIDLPVRTRTPTRSQTSRCWRSWATPWPSTPTRSSGAWPRSGNGTSATSGVRSGSARASCRRRHSPGPR